MDERETKDVETREPSEWPSSMSSEGRPHGDETPNQTHPTAPHEDAEPVLPDDALDENGQPS